MNFFAIFEEVGISELLEFNSESDRDRWVNYQDSLSVSLNTTKDNAPFQRVALDDVRLAMLVKTAINTTSYVDSDSDVPFVVHINNLVLA